MEEGREGGREKGKEDEGNGEDKKKVGRPSKAESLMRERSNSMPLLELLKRGEKRKGTQGGETVAEEGEKRIFKRSTKITRSPERQEEGGLSEILKEVREGFREIKNEMREIKEGREEMREWMEEMRKKVDSLEKRVEEIEKGRGGTQREEGGRGKGKGEEREQVEIREKREMKELEERMRKLELEGEKNKREERKRNVIIKGVKVKEEGKEGLRGEIEGIVEATGAMAKIEGMRRIGNKDKEGREMVWVRFASVREKIDVMKGKAKLRDRREWIVDDLTEKERRVEWWMKKEAEKNRREGKKVRVGYMKIWIEEKLWVWDEMNDVLREWRGREVREEEKGEKGGNVAGNGKEVF
jgi:hypothetical protein